MKRGHAKKELAFDTGDQDSLCGILRKYILQPYLIKPDQN